MIDINYIYYFSDDSDGDIFKYIDFDYDDFGRSITIKLETEITLDIPNHISLIINDGDNYLLFTSAVCHDVSDPELEYNEYKLVYMDLFEYANYLDIPIEIRNLIDKILVK